MPDYADGIRKTILVSSSRSGTNYFLNIYSRCFPDDVILKEIFRKGSDSLKIMQEQLGLDEAALVALAETNPSDLWSRLIAHTSARGHGIIAKIFYYHDPINSPLWRKFKKECRVVHLIRRNMFEAYLSREVARRTGEWQALVNKPQGRKIEPFVIDAAEAEHFIETRRAQVLCTRGFFSRNTNYTEVFYEDIAASPQLCAATIGRIWDRDVSVLDVDTDLRKQKTEDTASLVLNYPEIASLDRLIL